MLKSMRQFSKSDLTLDFGNCTLLYMPDKEPTQIDVLDRLSPQESAIFQLVEHFLRLEQQPEDPEKPRHIFWWDYGIKTESIVREVRDGYTSSLPMPYEGDYYVVFGWRIEGAGVSKGHYQFRIYNHDGEYFFITANGPAPIKEDMREEWAAALDPIPYPFEVADRIQETPFEFQNKAYAEKYPSLPT